MHFDDDDVTSRAPEIHDALGRLAYGPDELAQLPTTIWATDTTLRLTFVHGRYLQRLGITPAAVVGKRLTDLLLDGREDHPMIHGHLTALAGGEADVRIEWGGEALSARIGPLRDSAGTIVGCIGAVQVVGWLPDDEGTIRESDIRLRRIIDSNMVGIVFGNADGRITDANEAFLHLAGYTREDLTADGLSWPALTPVESHTRQLRALEEIRETGRCTPWETDLITKTGHRVSVIIGVARLSARRREGVAFVLDVSERKRSERYLRAALACADVLIAATDVTGAIETWLRVACEGLGVQGAALWRNGPGGTLEDSTAWPSARDAHRPFAAHVAEAIASGAPVHVPHARAIIVPLIAGTQALGAVIFAGSPDQSPDDALIASCQTIATQFATFLVRKG